MLVKKHNRCTTTAPCLRHSVGFATARISRVHGVSGFCNGHCCFHSDIKTDNNQPPYVTDLWIIAERLWVVRDFSNKGIAMAMAAEEKCRTARKIRRETKQGIRTGIRRCLSNGPSIR